MQGLADIIVLTTRFMPIERPSYAEGPAQEAQKSDLMQAYEEASEDMYQDATGAEQVTSGEAPAANQEEREALEKEIAQESQELQNNIAEAEEHIEALDGVTNTELELVAVGERANELHEQIQQIDEEWRRIRGKVIKWAAISAGVVGAASAVYTGFTVPIDGAIIPITENLYGGAAVGAGAVGLIGAIHKLGYWMEKRPLWKKLSENHIR